MIYVAFEKMLRNGRYFFWTNNIRNNIAVDVHLPYYFQIYLYGYGN